MRKLLTAILVFGLLLPCLSFAGGILEVDQSKNTDAPGFLGYVPDRFVIVLKEDVSVDHAKDASTSIALANLDGLDELALRFGVTTLKPQFPGSDRAEKSRGLSRNYKVWFGTGTLEEAMAAYRQSPLIESVEPIGIHAMYATPNDTYFSPYQWYHNQANDDDIDSPEAWDIQTGSTSTIIALLDSGTRYYHPDLGGANASVSNPGASRGNMWINTAELNGSSGVDDDGNGFTDDWIGWDFIQSTSGCWSGEDCNTQDNDPRDFNGHGTHTAGIMGMMTNDGYGMAGVAGGWGNGSQAVTGNGVKIMPLRMGFSYNYFGQEYGVVYMDAAAEAFYYAADNGAKIASCSWGSSNSGGIGTAATYFTSNGGLIFVAAGNDGTETPGYLNSRSDCISVAATDQNDGAASFTTYGTWVDISAPGVGIYSTYHDHTDANTIYWASMDGTSMACPMAAAVGGLIWSQNPTWTASQVENQLYASADSIDAELASKYIGKMGAGRINAYAAVNTGPPPAPVANFSGSPTSGSEPLNVNFTDLSTGSITSWSWTFGDGGTSTAQNPLHTYNSAGTYNVSLTVTGPGGSDGETKNGYITVNPCVTPTAGFTGSPTSGDYPLSVNFTNSSSGATSYSWTFGDGGTSTATNPSHTYTTAGTFTVILTATNSCGSDQMVRTNYITATTPPCYPPVAAFSGSPTSGDYDLIVSFTDLSTNLPTSWNWTFGDGGTSTAQNPTHTYTAAGTYTVSLTATNGCGSDGETKTAYITVTEPPVGQWVTITYDDFESGWGNYVSGGSDCILYTSGTYAHQGSRAADIQDNSGIASSFYHTGSYNVSGYSDLEVEFWFYAVSMETNEDFWLQYYNGSTWQTVATWAAGTGFSNNTFYNKVVQIPAGTYNYPTNAQLRFVCDASGNADDVYIDEIEFRGFTGGGPVPPVAAFVGSPTSGALPLSVNFTDQSTGDITSYSWTFGDGGTSTAQNPSHQYTAAGTYTVALTVSGPGGNDTETKTNYITVYAPPVAAFVGAPTSGDYPLTVDFTNQSTGTITAYSWTFGDGGTSTAQNPSHEYTAAGTHTVSLTATGPGGNDTETKTDYITVTTPGGGGWTTITYDDFESGFGSYTDGGGDCARYTGGTYAHQGSAAADIQDNSGTASSFYHTGSYNVSGFVDLEVEFWFRAVSMETNEDFWLQYYDGSTWRTVATWAAGAGFSNNTFYNKVVQIPAGSYNYPTNAKLRFMCDASGNTDDVYIDEIEFRGLNGTAGQAGRNLLIPEDFSLTQNYPNPFNPTTEIAFSLPQASKVNLTVYNVLGQQVATLADGEYAAGRHVVTWNALSNASGVYFYRLDSDYGVISRKMMLLK
ncbi:MAG: PKD domain-containing protein [bacterium]